VNEVIYSLQGTLLLIESNFLVIQCAGVGYKCLTSSCTQGECHNKIGKEVTIYTYMNVRQDAVDLFGFSSSNELNCFKLLTSVSGVGPKAALAILSQFTSEKVAALISSGDSKSLTSASGIGAKTAQRIVLELKDKLSHSIAGTSLPAGAILPSCTKNIGEATRALEVLGYCASDVMPILAKCDENLSVEELIKTALKYTGKGV
jgi:holliday junction DNA helicase RuvA